MDAMDDVDVALANVETIHSRSRRPSQPWPSAPGQSTGWNLTPSGGSGGCLAHARVDEDVVDAPVARRAGAGVELQLDHAPARVFRDERGAQADVIGQ